MINKDYAGNLSDRIIQDSCISPVHSNFEQLISRFENERVRLVEEVLSKLWDRMMSSCKAFEQGRALLVSEKAIACLIRRGADKKNIILNGANARVQLNNFAYYINKEGAGCSAGPCGYTGFWSHMPMRWIALSGEDLADFMFEFDGLVPDILMKIDERLHEFRIKATQYEILCQSINHLGKMFLKPYGIEWNVETDFTETCTPVNFSDGEHQPIHELIPTEKLTDVFQSIPERMAAQPMIPKSKFLSWEEMLFGDGNIGNFLP